MTHPNCHSVHLTSLLLIAGLLGDPVTANALASRAPVAAGVSHAGLFFTEALAVETALSESYVINSLGEAGGEQGFRYQIRNLFFARGLDRRLFIGVLAAAPTLFGQPQRPAPPHYQTVAQRNAIGLYAYGLRQAYAGDPAANETFADAADAAKDMDDAELAAGLDDFTGRVLALREQRPARLDDRDAWLENFSVVVQNFNDRYLSQPHGWVFLPSQDSHLLYLGLIEKREEKQGVYTDVQNRRRVMDLPVLMLEMMPLALGLEPDNLGGATEFGPVGRRAIAVERAALEKDDQFITGLYNAVSETSRTFDAVGLSWLASFYRQAYEKDGVVAAGQLTSGASAQILFEYLLHETVHAFNNARIRLHARDEAFANLTTVFQLKSFIAVAKLLHAAYNQMPESHDTAFDPANPRIGTWGILSAYELARASGETEIADRIRQYDIDALKDLAEKLIAMDADTLSQKADTARQAAGRGLAIHDGRFDFIDRPKPAPPAPKKKLLGFLGVPFWEFFRAQREHPGVLDGAHAFSQAA